MKLEQDSLIEDMVEATATDELVHQALREQDFDMGWVNHHSVSYFRILDGLMDGQSLGDLLDDGEPVTLILEGFLADAWTWHLLDDHRTSHLNIEVSAR